MDDEQDVVAADDESSFTFDVDGLSDEALDRDPSVRCCVHAYAWVYAYIGDEMQYAGQSRIVVAMRNPI